MFVKKYFFKCRPVLTLINETLLRRQKLLVRVFCRKITMRTPLLSVRYALFYLSSFMNFQDFFLYFQTFFLYVQDFLQIFPISIFSPFFLYTFIISHFYNFSKFKTILREWVFHCYVCIVNTNINWHPSSVNHTVCHSIKHSIVRFQQHFFCEFENFFSFFSAFLSFFCMNFEVENAKKQKIQKNVLSFSTYLSFILLLKIYFCAIFA